MKSLQIVLGTGWKQFAFFRDDLSYLGTIKRGLEVGALAKDSGGNFLQVNGDIRQFLNKSRIEAQLREMASQVQSATRFRQPTVEERTAVTVVVKPRRRVMEPSA